MSTVLLTYSAPGGFRVDGLATEAGGYIFVFTVEVKP